MVFRRPSFVPSEGSLGRLVINAPFKRGDLCRWCRQPIDSILSRLHAAVILHCQTCDGPIEGDNTMLKVD